MRHTETIARLELCSAMVKDRAGNIVNGWLYQPKKPVLSVPEETQCHARPLVVCTDRKGHAVVILAVNPQGIEFVFGDGAVTYLTFATIRSAF